MPSSPPSLTAALAEGAAAAVVTALAAVLGTVAHQQVAGAGRWPLGLLLALALAGCTAAAVRAASTVPAGRWGAALGWVAGLLVAAQSPPGGDVLVPPNARGYAWLLGSLLLVALVLALPAPRRRAEVRVGR